MRKLVLCAFVLLSSGALIADENSCKDTYTVGGNRVVRYRNGSYEVNGARFFPWTYTYYGDGQAFSPDRDEPNWPSKRDPYWSDLYDYYGY